MAFPLNSTFLLINALSVYINCNVTKSVYEGQMYLQRAILETLLNNLQITFDSYSDIFVCWIQFSDTFLQDVFVKYFQLRNIIK